ncbi:MarR family winged helix-turn-helix transcriptional regulator [Rhabdothermincola salaria]|uniref:MarR family winged helix-turn-helix transcriptional regulator n=1 Tax=Rhabdothermincola salaria TaxID=2903142 RepID=UPI001E502DE0|nr:MarR family transcriptional regulator [Rhabdothermincola salaria]MCD9623666.1 MarR family transcriptional regulator [Rhabdothermincola salaria]
MSSPASRRRLNESISALARFTRSRKLDALHAERAGVSLNFPAFSVLGRLVADGPLGVGELGRRSHMAPNALSRQVKVLEDAGYLERRAHPDDGRSWVLAATPDGRAAHRRLREANETMLARQLRDWTDDDMDALAAGLERLVADLRRQ